MSVEELAGIIFKAIISLLGFFALAYFRRIVQDLSSMRKDMGSMNKNMGEMNIKLEKVIVDQSWHKKITEKEITEIKEQINAIKERI